MGADSKIEWTHHTFNPWIGCAKVSPGCEHCYAEVGTFTRRLRAEGSETWGPKAQRYVTSDANWQLPLRWNRAAAAGERRRVFCASMADVFEDRADLIEPRARLWRLIMDTPHLDWLLLTKRPENLVRMVPWTAVRGAAPWDNVWLGTTVEDQRRADERIPHLLRAPAAVRFLSCEPLLGPVNLWHVDEEDQAWRGPGVVRSGGMTASTPSEPSEGYDDSYVGIDWVIVGGESGHGARLYNMAWARSIIGQCRAAHVPVFHKQAGARPIDCTTPNGRTDGHMVYVATGFACAFCAGPLKLLDKKGGDPAEWPEDLRVREYPAVRQ